MKIASTRILNEKKKTLFIVRNLQHYKTWKILEKEMEACNFLRHSEKYVLINNKVHNYTKYIHNDNYVIIKSKL